MTKNEIWTNLNRMQQAAMARDSHVTKSQFFDQPEAEQRGYYNWMRQQVSSFTAGPYWAKEEAA